jgi:hypothetical protein
VSAPSPEHRSPRRTRRAGKLTGAELISIGAMIVLLCGTCTLSFDLSALGHSNYQDFVACSLFGGVPVAIGIWIIVTGLRMRRRYRASHVDGQPGAK